MNNRLIIIICATFLFNLYAIQMSGEAHKLIDTDKEKALIEIRKIIKEINFDFESLDKKVVKVRFIINEKREVVVLSTDHEELDKSIKYSLNYRSMNTKDLEVNHIYILPVSFELTKEVVKG